MGGFSTYLWLAVVTKVPASMIYVVDFQNKSEHVIKSKYFLEVQFLALHRKRKRRVQIEPTPFYSQSQVVSACQALGM